MLTKDDLKEIRKVVREEVVAEVKDSTSNIEGTVRVTALHTREDVKGLDNRLKNVEIRNDNILADVQKTITSELKPINKSLAYLTRTVKLIAKNYDETDVDHEKRIKRIEDALPLPETN